MPEFDNAKDLFKWLASDELTKEEIIGMMTEEMCAELIVNNNMPYLEKNGENYEYHYDGEVVGTFKAPRITSERLEILLCNAISCLEEYGCDGAQLIADIGISDEEYNLLFNDDIEIKYAPVKLKGKLPLEGQMQNAEVQKVSVASVGKQSELII